jgi:DNA-binding PadR family transcriptional regulator
MGERPPTTPDTDQPAYLTPVVYHTLLALADAPLHGYGISQEVMRVTGERVSMGPGTLYGTLQRLHDAGWVERTDAIDAVGPHAERRRYYRLTKAGRSVLSGEARRLAHATDLARAHAVLDGS